MNWFGLFLSQGFTLPAAHATLLSYLIVPSPTVQKFTNQGTPTLKLKLSANNLNLESVKHRIWISKQN